ncbi:hypothetical protein OH492_18475 [Vibrio chagasii]|nr:hypothetical protein [Vibrio chagasii]
MLLATHIDMLQTPPPVAKQGVPSVAAVTLSLDAIWCHMVCLGA